MIDNSDIVLRLVKRMLDAEDRAKYLTVELDAAKSKLDEWVKMHDEDIKPSPQVNPALENVLAKVQKIVEYFRAGSEHEQNDSYILYGLSCNGRASAITLGDLRRWVESEKEAAK